MTLKESFNRLFKKKKPQTYVDLQKSGISTTKKKPLTFEGLYSSKKRKSKSKSKRRSGKRKSGKRKSGKRKSGSRRR